MTKPSLPRPPLGTAVMHGVTWMFLASVAAKSMGLVTLYVTGLLLSKEEFALYAVAIAWGEILGYLKCGGLQKILIQRGRSFNWLFPNVLSLSAGINLLWFVLLLGAAPVVAEAYDAPEVKALIFVIALSLPATTISALLEAKVSIDLRFGVLSAKNVYAALVRNCGIIVLALLEFGPMSFAIPLVLMSLFETIYLYRKAGVSCRPKWPSLRIFKPLARHSAWIMFGMLAVALAVNGDYMVIGILEPMETLGVYFFGYQLTVAIFTMLTRSLWAVLTPSFASINLDRPRQERAFLRALETSALVIFFISFAMATVAEPLVHVIWSGKWDLAVPVIQILGVTALPRVITPIARALLEARGQWRFVATITWVDALGLITSAAIGAALGGLLSIVIAVGIYNVLLALAYVWVTWKSTDHTVKNILLAVFSPYMIAGLALLTSWGIGLYVPPFGHTIFEAVLLGGVYVASFAAFTWLFKRNLLNENISRLKKLTGKG